MIIIAEIGINHNGDLDKALELIKHAKDCGCDVVKFQKRTPEVCVPKSQRDIMKYDTPWGDITYMEYKYKVEFEKNEYDIINATCKNLGIEWTASAWDIPAFEFLKQYNLKYHKICSPLLTNLDFLSEVASYGRYTFISTGMSTMDDISKAVDIFRKADCSFELMHTVSAYPMEDKDANLRVMSSLENEFNCFVGYSGHEAGLQISVAAAALGATSIERHVTLDRTMWGSDQAASLGKSGLQKLVRDCRVVEAALGDGIKRMLPSEESKRKSLRG